MSLRTCIHSRECRMGEIFFARQDDSTQEYLVYFKEN